MKLKKQPCQMPSKTKCTEEYHDEDGRRKRQRCEKNKKKKRESMPHNSKANSFFINAGFYDFQSRGNVEGCD